MSINFTSHFYEIFNISIYLQNNMYISDNATHKLYHINTSYTIKTNQPAFLETNSAPPLVCINIILANQGGGFRQNIVFPTIFLSNVEHLIFLPVCIIVPLLHLLVALKIFLKRRFLLNHLKQHFPDKRKGDEERFL